MNFGRIGQPIAIALLLALAKALQPKGTQPMRNREPLIRDFIANRPSQPSEPQPSLSANSA